MRDLPSRAVDAPFFCNVSVTEDKVRLGLFTAMPVMWDLDANCRMFEETVERYASERPGIDSTYGMAGEFNEWWMRTRSSENEKFVAFVHPNETFVSGPKGEIVARLQTNRPRMRIVDVDLSKATDDANLWPGHMKDRRPDLYQELTLPKM